MKLRERIYEAQINKLAETLETPFIVLPEEKEKLNAILSTYNTEKDNDSVAWA